MAPIAVRSIGELVQRSRDHFTSIIGGDLSHSTILYRGQADAQWPLQTTLERFSECRFSMAEYMNFLSLVEPRLIEPTRSHAVVERYSARSWAQLTADPQLLGLMARLRHQGFPSPLLDWTASPYIAAYFCFRDSRAPGPVAVYAYKESNGSGKSTWSGEPHIRSVGHNLRTHRRHYTQQAQYTLCLAEIEGAASFGSHEDVFARGDLDQDLLARFILPAEIRDDALTELHSMNINEHSLFGSEEGLCRALAQELIPRSTRQHNRI